MNHIYFQRYDFIDSEENIVVPKLDVLGGSVWAISMVTGKEPVWPLSAFFLF